MQKSVVALIECRTYEEDEVYSAVKKGMDLLGGAASFFKEGENILIKPNLLAGAGPENCVTTHPAVFNAVVRGLKNIGLSLSYGDSPGLGKPEAVARKAGLEEIALKHNVSLADFEGSKRVLHKKAIAKGSFPLVMGVIRADGVVSVCKLKSHGLTRLTGAVKNQYGCIPGMKKAQYHARIPLVHDFCRFLIDINTFIKPRLYIMDAIIAMEGNGPNSGDPKKLGCLLFSTDPVALDATACRIVDLNPEFVPTNKTGQQAGFGTHREEKIEIVGDQLQDVIDRSFRVTRKPAFSIGSEGLARYIKTKLMPKPVIDITICNKCGKCVDICSVEEKAVFWEKGSGKKKAPVHEYNRCIRCFCCQESCPEGAIAIKSSMLEPLLMVFSTTALVINGIKTLIKMTQRKMKLVKRQ
jgi:uncharacterized protein (DUF362 family)/Pyruvate/2-oxoacid:ferredoxin oxidoreductase delta subunit